MFRFLKCRFRAADRTQQPHRAGPQQERGDDLPRNDHVIKRCLNPDSMDRTPHTVIAWKGGIHEQHVMHELIVRIVISQIVEHHQRVIKGRRSYQQGFRKP